MHGSGDARITGNYRCVFARGHVDIGSSPCPPEICPMKR